MSFFDEATGPRGKTQSEGQGIKEQVLGIVAPLLAVFKEMHADRAVADARTRALSAMGGHLLFFLVIAPLGVKRFWNRAGVGDPITVKQARSAVVLLSWAAAIFGSSARQGQRNFEETTEAVAAYKEALRGVAR